MEKHKAVSTAFPMQPRYEIPRKKTPYLTNTSVGLAASPDASVPNMVCSAHVRPRVATCITGLVRTFSSPIVYRTLKTNLVDAFGGEQVVVLYLRRGRGFSHQGLATEGLEPSQASIDQAIAHLAPAKVEWGKQDEFASTTVCGNGDGYSRGASERRRQTNYINSLVAQAASAHRLHAMLLQLERERGIVFDLVLKLRSDLAFPVPIHPYCFWRDDAVYAKHDWLWLMPRSFAAAVLHEPWERYQDCSTSCFAGACTIEGFMSETIGHGLTTRALPRKLWIQAWDIPGMVVREPPKQRAGETAVNMCGRPQLMDTSERDIDHRAFCLSLTTFNPHNRIDVDVPVSDIKA